MKNAMLLQDAMGFVDDAIIDKAANTYVTKRRVSKWPGIVATAAAVIALVILLSSSIHPRGEKILQAKYYAIYNADGVYTMDGGLGGGNSDLNASRPGYSVKFTSLSEMRRIIFEGQLSDNALRALKGFQKAKNGGILLFDPNNMQDITVPEDVWVNGLISWYGCSYIFEFENENFKGSLTYSVLDDSKERAEDSIDTTAGDFVRMSTYHDPERNATVTVWEDLQDQRTRKQVVYTHTAGNKTVTFVETYWDGADQETPDRIEFWGTENGHYFYGGFSYLKERPSLEYLMQFGLKPFIEE